MSCYKQSVYCVLCTGVGISCYKQPVYCVPVWGYCVSKRMEGREGAASDLDEQHILSPLVVPVFVRVCARVGEGERV